MGSLGNRLYNRDGLINAKYCGYLCGVRVCLATDMFLPPRWLFIIARQFEEEHSAFRSLFPSIRVITVRLRLRQRQISRNWHLLMLEILHSHLFLSLPPLSTRSSLCQEEKAIVPRPLNPYKTKCSLDSQTKQLGTTVCLHLYSQLFRLPATKMSGNYCS